MKESVWIAPWWATIAAIGQCIAALVAAWAAIAAQRSATLAKRTVDIMERTSQNGDRAYISMDEISVGFEGNDRPPVFFTVLRNAGKTPAHNVRLGFHVLLVKREEEAASYPVHFDDGRISVAPGGVLKALGAMPESIKPHELEALIKEKAYLVGLGEVAYDDIFGREHKTVWGVRYKENAPGHFIMTPFHNYMD